MTSVWLKMFSAPMCAYSLHMASTAPVKPVVTSGVTIRLAAFSMVAAISAAPASTVFGVLGGNQHPVHAVGGLAQVEGTTLEVSFRK